MTSTLESRVVPHDDALQEVAATARGVRPVVAALVLGPPIVMLGDAAGTGVDPAAVLAYSLTWLCSLLVAAVVSRYPDPFDVFRFRFGGVFVVVFLLTMLLGAPSVFSEFYETRSAWPYLISIIGGFLVTVVGLVLGDQYPRNRSDIGSSEVPAATAAGTAVLLGIIGVSGLLVYLAVTPRIPLVEALNGTGNTDLARAREESLTLLGSPLVAYLFEFTRAVALPAAAALLLLVGLRRRSRVAIVGGVVFTVVALSAGALTTEKSTVGRVVLIIAIAIYCARGRPPSWRMAVLIGLMFLLFPFAISRVTNAPANSNVQIMEVLGDRMFRVPTNVHYHYVAYVDEDLAAHLLGRTIPNLGVFSPGQAVDLTGDVQQRIFPGAAVRGNANGSYLSNFYADFGMIGVLLGGLATGLALAWLDRLATHWLADPFSAVFRAVTVVQILFLTSSSVFNSVLQFPFGNLTVLVLFAFVSALWLPVREVVRYGGPKLDAKTAA